MVAYARNRSGKSHFGCLFSILIVAVGIYVSIYTRFGRTCYAVGGNEEAALLMGRPVGRTKLRVYALSGFCSSWIILWMTADSMSPLNGRFPLASS
jgi:ribose/xylose/arabinose/galactoside ABC-type transport system permease subunit